MQRLVAGCCWLMVMLVTAVPVRAERYALLVGVQSYGQSSGLTSLKFPEKDVEDLAALLVKSGYKDTNVIVMTVNRGTKNPDLIPSRERIQHTLDLLLSGLEPGDGVIVAFAGHGVQFKDDEKNYFCPADAQLLERKNLLDFQDVYASLKECQATYKLLLSDACRNDPFERSFRAASPSATRPSSPVPEGTTVALFSCDAGEMSWEDEDFGHGVFFPFLLLGLKGDADRKSPLDANAIANGNGTVELHELIAYTQTNVKDFVQSKRSSRQRPVLRTDSNNLQLTQRFPLLSVPETKPLAAGSKAGEFWDGNSLGIKFRWCPAGKFRMGSPTSEKGRKQIEAQVDVTLTTGYWLGQHEVTQAEWIAVMHTTPWRGHEASVEGDRYPVTYINWEEADEFCEKLTAKGHSEGWLPKEWEFDLPTEAQWEYACRAGTTSRYSFGEDESQLGQYAWYADNASQNPQEQGARQVGQKRPNPWGIYDMHGNVWEWCRDWLADQLPGGTDPYVRKGEQFRVHRGGSWFFSSDHCRSAFRTGFIPAERNIRLGFRVAVVDRSADVF